MNDGLLEKVYEVVILPNYPEINISAIHWKDHGKVDHDAWAHYFDDENGREYVLLFEDFPGGTFLDDGLTHELVETANRKSIRYSLDAPFVYVENLTGYFTLYKEKDRN